MKIVKDESIIHALNKNAIKKRLQPFLPLYLCKEREANASECKEAWD